MSYLSLILRLEVQMVEQPNWNAWKRKLTQTLPTIKLSCLCDSGDELDCLDLSPPCRAELGNKHSPWERVQ
jgi:hypothetical protein